MSEAQKEPGEGAPGGNGKDSTSTDQIIPQPREIGNLDAAGGLHRYLCLLGLCRIDGGRGGPEWARASFESAAQAFANYRAQYRPCTVSESEARAGEFWGGQLRVSIRQIAIAMGMSRSTAHRTIEKLLNDGRVSLITRSAMGSSTYSINQCSLRGYRLHAHKGVFMVRDTAKDNYGSQLALCWHHGALGPVARDVWENLTDWPNPLCDIAMWAKHTRKTTLKWARELAAVGLAEQKSGGWLRGPRDPRDLDAHFADVTRRRRAQITTERELYRAYKEANG